MTKNELFTIKQASQWASEYMGKNVTPSNITYLIQYGRIRKVVHNGTSKIAKDDMLSYYRSFSGKREIEWKKELGDDLNWALSFDYLKEKETTKHVHRLHPYFPSSEYKYKVRQGKINQKIYGADKEQEFLPVFQELLERYDISLKQTSAETFLDKWYLQAIRQEIDFVFDMIKQIDNQDTKKVVEVILSRTIRTCRATTHADLATLKEPITTTYYCRKHGKICKPLFSIVSW